MTAIDTDIARIGDALQTRWRIDARRARSRRRAGLTVSFIATALAISAVAMAAGIGPFRLTSDSARPSAAALAAMRRFAPRTTGTARGVETSHARVIGTLTGSSIGKLSIVVAPLSPRGGCVDAALPSGASYVAACVTFRGRAVTTGGERIGYFQGTASYEGARGRPPLALLFRSVPPGTARVDVRRRDGSSVPVVLGNGWMVAQSDQNGAAALVRFYDASGRRILSFYG